jgi:cell division protein FtsZ
MWIEMGTSVRVPWPAYEFDPEAGRMRAECPSFIRELKRHVEGADLIIITAGMGGPYGTGASPVIARVVRETGALLLAIVNMPFSFESREQSRKAIRGVQQLKAHADNVIAVPADFSIRGVDTRGLSFPKAFSLLDEVMAQAIRSVTDSINVPGLKNADLADVARVIRIPGESTVAFGLGTNPECPALDAIKKAISNTAQPVDLAKARGALVSFSDGQNTATSDYAEALNFLGGKIDPNVDPETAVTFGIGVDESLGDTVKATAIFTGIEALPAITG